MSEWLFFFANLLMLLAELVVLALSVKLYSEQVKQTLLRQGPP